MAHAVDGKAAAAALGRGIVACAARTGKLPPSSTRVPAKWTGKKYQSRPADWSGEAFRCASFSVAGPQAYRYQWLRIDAYQGAAVAETDFREDGSARREIVAPVKCTSPGKCKVLIAPGRGL